MNPHPSSTRPLRALLVAQLLLAGCAPAALPLEPPPPEPPPATPPPVATVSASPSAAQTTAPPAAGAPQRAATVALRAPKQLTGVAVSRTGRVFVNFPRWVDDPTPSVAEVAADESLTPYPDTAWNGWDKAKGNAKKQFVCVQSVFVDETDTLWILDPASPGFQGVVTGGAKLIQVDLGTNQVRRVYAFDGTVAPPKSYLNDVRIAQGHAFMTESGLGAIVVLNLATGAARRLLAAHPSTKAEAGVEPVIAGKPWKGGDGKAPQIHSDGIAIDPKREWLYYQALTGKTLYRVPIAALLDAKLSADALGARVERVAATQPTDGVEFDAQGNLYMTAIEDSAIKVLRPDGRLEIFAQSADFEWPDSIAFGPKGDLHFSASQIHFMPAFNGGTDKRKPPFRVFRIDARPSP